MNLKLTPSSEIQFANPEDLTPHESNFMIYHVSSKENLEELATAIEIKGILEPLQVTPSGKIISGHRRQKAAILAKLKQVPIIVKEYQDAQDELSSLVFHNMQRKKTPREIWNEGEAIKKILPKRGEGRRSDVIASKLNMGSGRQYERLDYVMRLAPPAILKAVDSGDMAVSHAYEQTRNLNQQSPKVKERAIVIMHKSEDDVPTAIRKARREIQKSHPAITPTGFHALNSSARVIESDESDAPGDEDDEDETEAETQAEKPSNANGYQAVLMFYPYKSIELDIDTPWKSDLASLRLMKGDLGDLGHISDLVAQDGLLFLWAYGKMTTYAMNLLKNFGFTHITQAAVRADKAELSDGFLKEDTAFLHIAYKDPSALKPSSSKSNFIGSYGKADPLAQTPAGLADFIMSFSDGPYLQLWGPELPARYLDEAWEVKRP